MTTIHIQLDDATYARLQQKAAAAGQMLEEYLAQRAREEAASTPPAPEQSEGGRSIIGLFADEPEAVDEMLATVMQMREQRNRAISQRADEIAKELDEPEGEA